MSFNVLVIPEDPVHNGHILKPLTKAVMADAGRPAAKVDVLSNPRLRGYDHAEQVIRHELPGRYRFKDLWLFFPDADKATDDGMQNLEKHVAEVTEQEITLLCCAAQPEVEIYACAAFRNDILEEWEDVRRHPRMKEEIFRPLLSRHGGSQKVGAARGRMIDRSLNNLPLLFQLCPELQTLRDRIAAHLRTPGNLNPAP